MLEESTTPDVAEALRGSVEAFDRGDFDATLAEFGSDAVWDTSRGGMGVFDGREAIRGFSEDWLAGGAGVGGV
jgi:ketosteroid isomerase-like protein